MLFSKKNRIKSYQKAIFDLEELSERKTALLESIGENREKAGSLMTKSVQSLEDEDLKEYLSESINNNFNASLRDDLEEIRKIDQLIDDNKLLVKALENRPEVKSSKKLFKHLKKLKKGKKQFKIVTFPALDNLRENLPQIDDLESTLLKLDIGVKRVKMKAKDFKLSQMEFNKEKILDIANNIAKGDQQPVVEFLISKDDFLADGHHNFAANLEIDKNMELVGLKAPFFIKKLVKKLNKFKKTQNKDIKDKEIKKAFETICIAHLNGDQNLTGCEFNKAAKQFKERFGEEEYKETLKKSLGVEEINI